MPMPPSYNMCTCIYRTVVELMVSLLQSQQKTDRTHK